MQSHRDGMRVNYTVDEKRQLVAEMRPFFSRVLGADDVGRADLHTLKTAV